MATGEDTQERFALIELVGRKGNVPPPHIHHREDETFYILEGENECTTLRGRKITVPAVPLIVWPHTEARC